MISILDLLKMLLSCRAIESKNLTRLRSRLLGAKFLCIHEPGTWKTSETWRAKCHY